MKFTKKVSINLDENTERQLIWLYQEYNREFCFNITLTDVIKIAINNEFYNANKALIDNKEEKHCEEEWYKNYISQ